MSALSGFFALCCAVPFQEKNVPFTISSCLAQEPDCEVDDFWNKMTQRVQEMHAGKRKPKANYSEGFCPWARFSLLPFACGQDIPGDEPVETEMPKRRKRKHSKVDRLVLD